ncbi:MinD/ParA family protein [Sulfuriflexus sp.]|uniref:MinD/ParA family protein n=1 Tax=Sulfuriflexus sp. TaxID=2015443 RepID=UPI0028CC5271|nr:MinD/ParA family protein [Sulfuriflexus sp.]MDT8403914.1 MinD/ParA family protein [Sulfuriflexus sp.]
MAEASMDQAEGMRRISQPKAVRVIAVASGKGGVGKTNVSVNLGMAMSGQGKQVMLLDADLGLGNVDVLLGVHPVHNLSHVISGERTLEEVIVDGPAGLQIVPAASGIKRMAELSPEEHVGLVRAFSELNNNLDVLIIDTAAGISDSVITLTRAAQEVLVVVCDEPASITDAYALIKVLNQEHGINKFHVMVNMVQSVQQGHDLFAKMLKVTDKFLDVTLDFTGTVPYDDYLRKAIQRQRAVSDAYPRSRSALAFKKLAQAVDKWPMPNTAGGHLEFFVERLVQSEADQWLVENVS